MTIVLVIILIICDIVAAEEKIGWQIIFEDDFSNNNKNWWVGNKQEYAVEIKNGKYIFEHKRERGGWLHWNHIAITQKLDFQIDVALKKISGVEDGGYGIIWDIKKRE